MESIFSRLPENIDIGLELRDMAERKSLCEAELAQFPRDVLEILHKNSRLTESGEIGLRNRKEDYLRTLGNEMRRSAIFKSTRSVRRSGSIRKTDGDFAFARCLHSFASSEPNKNSIKTLRASFWRKTRSWHVDVLARGRNVFSYGDGRRAQKLAEAWIAENSFRAIRGLAKSRFGKGNSHVIHICNGKRLAKIQLCALAATKPNIHAP